MEYERALYRIYERAMEEVPLMDSPPDSISFLPPLLSLDWWHNIFLTCRRNVILFTWTRHYNYELSPLSDTTTVPMANHDENNILASSAETRDTVSHSEQVQEEEEEEEYSDHETPQPSNSTRPQVRRRRQRPVPTTTHASSSSTLSWNTLRFSTQGSNKRSKLQTCMQLLFWLALIHLILLFMMHQIFISSVRKQVISARKASSSSSMHHTPTTDMYSSSTTCIEQALATRPREERINTYFSLYGDYDYDNTTTTTKNRMNDNQTDTNSSRIEEEEPPLLFHDEILQIRLISDLECPNTTTDPCSRVHKVISSSMMNNNSTLSSTRTTPDTTDVEYWEKATHQYSSDRAILNFNEQMRYTHNITMVNVTLTYSCLILGKDAPNNNDHRLFLKIRILAFLVQIYQGYDTILFNQLMYGIRSTQDHFRDGGFKNLVSKQSFVWQASLLNEYERVKSNFFLRLMDKWGILLQTLVTFFLITSVTAFLVRVLTTSGVVVMFPLFALFRIMGVQDADERLLLYSYPWIGRQRQAAARERMYGPRNGTLITAHLGKLFLCYVLYEASEAEWGLMIYGKGSYYGDETTSLWIFGFFTLVEYFSLIFLRSALSVRFFSRIMLLYFLAYHFYFFSSPYSFFGLALIPWFCLIIHGMLFTMIVIEQPALSRGAVSLDCPREVFTKLPWSEFTASIPHEFTLFLPLNARYIPIHDQIHVEQSLQPLPTRTESNNGEHGTVPREYND